MGSGQPLMEEKLFSRMAGGAARGWDPQQLAAGEGPTGPHRSR